MTKGGEVRYRTRRWLMRVEFADHCLSSNEVGVVVPMSLIVIVVVHLVSVMVDEVRVKGYTRGKSDVIMTMSDVEDSNGRRLNDALIGRFVMCAYVYVCACSLFLTTSTRCVHR